MYYHVLLIYRPQSLRILTLLWVPTFKEIPVRRRAPKVLTHASKLGCILLTQPLSNLYGNMSQGNNIVNMKLFKCLPSLDLDLDV